MSKMWGPKQMIRILLRIRRITWKEKCKTTTKTMNAMKSTIMKTVRTKTARTNTTTAKTMATMTTKTTTTNKTATKTKTTDHPLSAPYHNEDGEEPTWRQ